MPPMPPCPTIVPTVSKLPYFDQSGWFPCGTGVVGDVMMLKPVLVIAVPCHGCEAEETMEAIKSEPVGMVSWDGPRGCSCIAIPPTEYHFFAALRSLDVSSFLNLGPGVKPIGAESKAEL